MTFHTGILWDLSMHFNPFIATGDKAEHHFGIFNQALLMTSMALYFLMFTGGPAVPRFLHKMTGITEFWVVLHIVVKTDYEKTTNGNSNNNNDCNRYLFYLNESNNKLPKIP
jgi:hypothetical protein